MLCCATAIFAQNNKISYQAVVRDTANRLVANKTVTVTVNIFNGDAQTAAYSETHTNVQTNYNGLFSLQMGNGTNQSGDWNAIQWKNARVTTAVSLDGTELATLNMPLTAVPYALYADYAEEINPDAVVVTNITNRMNTISDSVKTNFDNIAGNTSKLNALQNRVNVFNTHVCDTVMNCDGIKTMRDSIQTNAAAIADLQSADAAITNRMNTISDSVKTNFDNIAGNTSKLNALQNRVNTFNTNICDTVMHCEKIIVMRDSIQKNAAAITTIQTTKANASDVYTTAQVDALLAAMTARIDSLANVTKNLPKMAQDSFTVATNDQDNFELKNVPDADHVLRMYINGVMVGGSHSGVLTIPSNSTNTKEVVYNPEKNKNRDGEAYALKAGDKVTVVYWYVEPATAITSGN